MLNDQDSDFSFQEDEDDDIVKCEKEDWIDFMEKSTKKPKIT